MSDLPDRDRVTAILTLADAAYYEPWEADGAEVYHAVTRDWIADALNTDQQAEGEANAAFIAASRSETPWLARTLLKALDTIDRLEGENAEMGQMLIDVDNLVRAEAEPPVVEKVTRILNGDATWQALNGGNE